MALALPAQVMGLIVSGDVAGYTIYTDRHGRKTTFPQSPPKEPPSALQLQQRARFRIAQHAWASLGAHARATLELVTQRCSLCLTGQNLYIAIALKKNPDWIPTLERQSRLTLPPIPFVGHDV